MFLKLHPFAPPGQRVAVAHDGQFCLCLSAPSGWMAPAMVLKIHLFSPLADETPDPAADCGVSAWRLSRNVLPVVWRPTKNFSPALRQAALNGAFVYGECGGYMVLGEALVDASGTSHPMADLLPLVTSFEHRKLAFGLPVGAADNKFALCR